MKAFSALLALCAGNSPVTGEFPPQRPVTLSFDVFCHLCPNKRLSKQPCGWWFETPSRSLWRHRNVYTWLKVPLVPWDYHTDCNSLRPSGAIWQEIYGSTLLQVMAYGLTVPTHYLNRRWLIINGVLWHSPKTNFRGSDQNRNSRNKWTCTLGMPHSSELNHDDVIKWTHSSRYWPFVRGIRRRPMVSLTQRLVTRSVGIFFDLRL